MDGSVPPPVEENAGEVISFSSGVCVQLRVTGMPWKWVSYSTTAVVRMHSLSRRATEAATAKATPL